jgi:microcystin-dependent protein
MATLSITKQWANGEVLLEADLDYIKSDIETFLNTTKINDDNIQAGGITGSTKLVDLSVTVGKLATDSVSTAKILDSNVTTAKIADLNVTLAKLAAAAIASLRPVGEVTAYGGTSAPSGWLLCDGSAISRTTYSSLFTAISTTYGVGDGSTTFNIPDIRGRVIAGQDDMGGTSANRLTNQTGGLDGDTLGATGGAETHTLTEAQMPAHTHTTDMNQSTQYKAFVGSGAAEPVFSFGNAFEGSEAIFENPIKTSASTGGGGAHNNVQPTIVLNYIIRTGV